jgi:hypothetical protein
MVIVDDASNHLDANTLKTFSIEYNRIEHPPEYTNILKPTQTGMLIIIGCHTTNM